MRYHAGEMPITKIWPKTACIVHSSLADRTKTMCLVVHAHLSDQLHRLSENIRIGPDRAYPLHFTRPQLLLLPVLR